jgi:Flp pilus assembly protein TadG
MRSLQLVWKWPWNRDGRAQAMVEFAMILPVFLMAFLGVFEMGRLMLEYTSMANAAREAARVATIATYQPTFIVGEARRFSIVAGPTPVVTVAVSRNNVAVAPTARTTGDTVTVTLSHTFQPMGFLQDPNIPLSASAKMQVE